MNDTCIGQKACWFGKKHLPGPCPFFLETTWNNDSGQAKTVKDCAPKRSVLLQMEQHNRLMGIQKAIEGFRNGTQDLADRLKTGIPIVMEKNEHRGIGKDSVPALPHI